MNRLSMGQFDVCDFYSEETLKTKLDEQDQLSIALILHRTVAIAKN